MKDLRWCGRMLTGMMTTIAAALVFATSARAQQGGSEQPKGWLGISWQQDMDAPERVRYPLIVTVDPGSPAQAAGLMAGDTVLSYDKTDARGPLAKNIVQYLVPGRKLPIRYRRGGEVRESTIIVGKRSSTFRLDFTQLEFSTDSNGSVHITANDSIQINIDAVLAPIAIFQMMGDVPVAGANMMRMNPELASTLGVGNSGVFVIDVTPDTPADKAGLRSGDVIVTINKVTANDPSMLVKALYEAKRGKKSKDVSLNVQRKGKPVHLVLK